DGDRELDERRETVMKQVKALNTGITTLDETIEAAKQSVETAKGNVVQASSDVAAAKLAVDQRAEQIRTENDALKTELGKLDEALKATRLEPSSDDPEALIAVALGPLA